MFVTLEGPEGAGKSTVVSGLSSWLGSLGRAVVTTREPGGSAIGPAVRSVLLEGGELDPWTELFLFLADRREHVQKLVQPSLAGGAIVLCDRYSDSSVVYQGYGRGLDVEEVRRLCDLATDGLKPSLTLLLDLPVEVGLDRIKHKDRLDTEPEEFHRRVRDGFLAEADDDPSRWVVVDASRSPEEVLNDCQRAISARL